MRRTALSSPVVLLLLAVVSPTASSLGAQTTVASGLQAEATWPTSPELKSGVASPTPSGPLLFATSAAPLGISGHLDSSYAQRNAGLLPSALEQEARRRGVDFMIGGGVAVIVGSVVGGDGGALIMLGGLGALGYGLYLYLDP